MVDDLRPPHHVEAEAAHIKRFIDTCQITHGAVLYWRIHDQELPDSLPDTFHVLTKEEVIDHDENTRWRYHPARDLSKPKPFFWHCGLNVPES